MLNLDFIIEPFQNALLAVLPESFAQYIVGFEHWVFVAITVLLVSVLLAVSLFFDFVKDAWKLPFAIVVDLLIIAGFSNPLFWWLAAMGAVLIFILLSGLNVLRWLFAVIGALSALSMLAFPESSYVVLFAMLPINSVLMFLATILD